MITLSLMESRERLDELVDAAAARLSTFRIKSPSLSDKAAVIIGEDLLWELVRDHSCSIEWGYDGELDKWTAYAPEIDVHGQGASQEDALNDLRESALEYADLYLEDVAFYFSVDRKDHLPWLLALRLAPGETELDRILGLR